MSRRRPSSTRSPEEIRAQIAENEQQIAALTRDIEHALLAGECTAPYRGAIVDITGTVIALKRDLAAAEAAEAAERRARATEAAGDVVRAAHRRYESLFSDLAVPALPPLAKEFLT